MKFKRSVFAAGLLALLSAVPSLSQAGVWTQPNCPTGDASCQDSFYSQIDETVRLELDGSDISFTGTGVTVVNHDLANAAFVQDGRDTINTEMVGLYVQGDGFILQVGYGTSILVGGVGLDYTRGQVQDLAASPVNGSIDFPANSIFDVFYDLWIDFDNSGTAEVGEVFSNDVRDAFGNVDPVSVALHMTCIDSSSSGPGCPLENMPPPVGTQYKTLPFLYTGGVAAYTAGEPENRNPELGVIQALTTQFPWLYPILPDRECAIRDINNDCVALAQVTAATQTVPVPNTFMLVCAGLGLLLHRRRASA